MSESTASVPPRIFSRTASIPLVNRAIGSRPTIAAAPLRLWAARKVLSRCARSPWRRSRSISPSSRLMSSSRASSKNISRKRSSELAKTVAFQEVEGSSGAALSGSGTEPRRPVLDSTTPEPSRDDSRNFASSLSIRAARSWRSASSDPASSGPTAPAPVRTWPSACSMASARSEIAANPTMAAAPFRLWAARYTRSSSARSSPALPRAASPS